ncbi:MAG: hypothetical protein WC711_03940 [Candidatus Staskawiczbacteria bacterium]|jgi:hypothetical protein
MEKSQIKICQNCKSEFVIELDDFAFYEKMKVPAPTFCPECRFKMLAIWRNEMSLYSSKKCDMCGKNIITMYNPKSPYKVYCYQCYMSDSWDARDYMRDYDFSRPFFEQFNSLLKDVPKKNTSIDASSGPNINSEYANYAGGMKDCYMVFNSIGEQMMYCRGIRESKETVDSYFGEHLEKCYECVNVFKSSGLIFARNTYNSMDSAFVINCNGLNNCFGCVNLRNKSYHFMNELLSREEYIKKIGEIMGSYSKMEEFKEKFVKFALTFPRKENNNIKNVNSNGDFLSECKDVDNSFEVIGAENSKNIFSSRAIHNADGSIGFGTKSELFFNCLGSGFSSNIICSCSVSSSHNILYSFGLINCHDCMGCDSLKNSEYCILNKQYTKEEYEKLKENIVGELAKQGLYGLMIPSEFSPFGYNETLAYDNMPLTKEEAIAQGFRWEDDIQMTTGKETLQLGEISDHIKDVNSTITKEILKCISCERNYKIAEQELSLYKKMNIPIPRKCFFCRHQDRLRRRGPYKFWNRKCDHCGKEINTNYAPDRPEIVYCESCYNNEVA